MARCGPCRHLLVERMRDVPVSNLSSQCKYRLAVLLDPPKETANRDYRYFAEHLGLTPALWQYLDSQKIAGQTSSSGLVLQHLIDEKGDAFTVYHVYQALRKMNSSGQQVLEEFMMDHWIRLGFDTRLGQENREESLCLCPQCDGQNRPPPPQNNQSPSYESANSYPPSYPGPPGPQRSAIDAHHGSADTLGLLGRRPEEHEYHRLDGHNNSTVRKEAYRREPAATQDTGSWNTFHQSASGDCFNRTGHHTEHSQGTFSQDPRGCGRESNPLTNHHFPESFRDWQDQPCAIDDHYRNISRNNETCLTETKNRHFSGDGLNPLNNPPQFHPPSDLGSVRYDGTFPENFLWNIPLDSSETLDNLSSCKKNQSLGSQPLPSSIRPVSFPKRLPSQQMEATPILPRPVSDGIFCSHQNEGACNCSAFERDFTALQTVHQAGQQSQGPVKDGGFGPTRKEWLEGDKHGWAVNGEISVPDASDGNHHNTQVREVLPMSPGQPVQIIYKYINIVDANGNGLQRNVPGQSLTKPEDQSPRERAGHFVLVLAGDRQGPTTLKDELEGLARALKRCGVPHVLVTSAWRAPVAWLSRAQSRRLPPLTQDPGSLEVFVKACYKQAKKILIAISPGYHMYADIYVEGSTEATDRMQRIIRRQHEKMKMEYAGSQERTHRLWPVLLHRMATDRTHVPTFLQRAYFYWFGRDAQEDVAVVLQRQIQEHRVSI